MARHGIRHPSREGPFSPGASNQTAEYSARHSIGSHPRESSADPICVRSSPPFTSITALLILNRTLCTSEHVEKIRDDGLSASSFASRHDSV